MMGEPETELLDRPHWAGGIRVMQGTMQPADCEAINMPCEIDWETGHLDICISCYAMLMSKLHSYGYPLVAREAIGVLDGDGFAQTRYVYQGTRKAIGCPEMQGSVMQTGDNEVMIISTEVEGCEYDTRGMLTMCETCYHEAMTAPY